MAAISGTVKEIWPGVIRLTTGENIAVNVNTDLTVNGARTKAGPTLKLTEQDLLPGDTVSIGVTDSQQGLARSVTATR